ncbi:hypothetical protein KRR26_13385 [Corallococcus sp. M34]|uniref:hypothetical protein n=1 Tax=Citreicoccus inhibens TaxID=2849499 RepID=UPI001C22DBA8|nr:hypothetical protein [Citreicoccus inhibens]MBU8896607.1 hypothetical protein [Citreicoccus inhibens]
MSHAQNGSWETLHASLDGYQPERIAAMLREYLTPRVPPGTRKLTDSERERMARDVQALLRENLGPWYTATGVELGNESLGGYCWCHTFFNEKPVTNLGVEHNVQRMLQALGRAHAWLRQLGELFEKLSRELPSVETDADIRALAIAEALVHVVELTEKATSCEEAWYFFADEALDWLLESQGLRLDHTAKKLWRQAFRFESWCAPPPERLRSGSEEVARALVRGEEHRLERKR